jgi:flavorubredoxin
MKIALVIHSYTGNTMGIADKIGAALVRKGHEVSLFPIKAKNENPNQIKGVELENYPNIQGFDHVIFGAPTRGMDLSIVMQLYLASLKEGHQSADIYITHFFPFQWMGGKQAINKFYKLSTNKLDIQKTGIINWKNKNRDKDIQCLVYRFTDVD